MENENPKTPKTFSMVMYDIPSDCKGPAYPNPAGRIRRYGVMMQYSVYCVPDDRLPRIADLIEDIRAVPGGKVRVLPYDPKAYEEIMETAREALTAEAERIRDYIEAAALETAKRLTAASLIVSVGDTNKAIGFQQTALSKATKDLTDAQECAMAFDLTGDLDALFDGVRKLLVGRSGAFAVERAAARATLPQVPKAPRKSKTVVVNAPDVAPASGNGGSSSVPDADDDDTEPGNGGGLSGLGSL